MAEEDEGRLVEAEIVGAEPRPPAWRRALSRLALSALLGLAGLACLALGLVLTLTVVGAGLGLPLLAVGAFLLLLALLAGLGAGTVRLGGPGRR